MKTYLVKRNDIWLLEGRTHAPHDAEFYDAPENEEPAWLEIVDVTELQEIATPILDGEGNETGEYTISEETVVTGQEVVVNQELKTQVLADRAAQKVITDQQEALQNIVQSARSFGDKLMTDFVIENIVMGITQDNMTEVVLDIMSPIEAALRTGSLHIAIKRIKEIPLESKDVKYITDARLLVAVNKLEEYLNLSLSETL